MLSDLRYAFRSLRKSPGFTAVVVLTLALGIGANSTIFSVINAVLLRPLPYHEPAGLVRIYETDVEQGNDRFYVALANYRDWKSRSRVFSGLAIYRERNQVLTGGGEPERIRSAMATADLFPVLGVAPAMGRAYTADEDRPGGAATVVLSDRLWRRRFAADPRVLGRTLMLSGRAYTVTGVMPPSFRFPSTDVDVWMPAAISEAEWAHRGAHNHDVVARLRPEVTVEQASAEMQSIGRQISVEHPSFQRDFGVAVYPLADEVAGGSRSVLLVLFGAVGFVLLIACANVANLYLARAAGRRKEMAIRSAIGAGTRHLVRQLLAESALLAGAGAVAGLVLAGWAAGAIATMQPEGLPRADEVTVDGAVLAFTAALALLTALLFGLAPALAATRTDAGEVLKDGTRGSSGGPGSARVRSALLVAEVAVSLVLLAGAGVMLKSFARLQSVDTGFVADHLLTARITLPPASYDSLEKVGFYDALLPRLRALPGVQGAAVVSAVPLSGQNASWGYLVEGRALATPADMPVAVMRVVGGDYFRTIGIPLVRGRVIEPRDDATAPRVAVVSEALAAQHFPGEDPIGKRVRPGGDPEGTLFEIVGVVGDSKHLALDERPRPQMYTSLALLLAAIGIYGVIAYSTAQRAREFGVRIALGARRADVLRAVLGDAVRLVVTGIVIGLGASLALTRVLESQLYEVSATDPSVLVGISLLLGATAIAASYLPARRATRVDPVVALRAE
jgi:putative ABC transport system permease protein